MEAVGYMPAELEMCCARVTLYPAALVSASVMVFWSSILVTLPFLEAYKGMGLRFETQSSINRWLVV